MKEKFLENNKDYKNIINKKEENTKPKIHFIYKYSIIMLLILEAIILVLSIKNFSR